MISNHVLRRLLRSDARVAMYGDLIRAATAAFLVIAGAWCVAYLSMLARHMFADLEMNDFGKFYYSARAFLDGGDMYGPNPATTVTFDATQARLANMNPPHFHLLLLPIARLSPLPALLIWTAASVVALAGSIVAITRELSLRWTPARVAWTFVLALAAAATATNVVTGQMTFLLLVPITLAWIDARHGRWTRAAIWLGLCASIKPFLLIFGAYLLVKRRWTAAVIMGAVTLLCFGAGVLIFGRAPYETWYRALAAVNWAWLPMNGSLLGLLSRSFGENPFFTPLVVLTSIVRPLALAGSVVVILITLVVLWRDEADPLAADHAFALLTMAALLASPLGWMYYLWLLPGPLAALVLARRNRASRTRSLAAAIAVPGLLCPTFLTLAWAEHRWGGLTLGSAYTWAFLALWIALLLDRRAADRKST